MQLRSRLEKNKNNTGSALVLLSSKPCLSFVYEESELPRRKLTYKYNQEWFIPKTQLPTDLETEEGMTALVVKRITVEVEWKQRFHILIASISQRRWKFPADFMPDQQ